MAFKPLKLASPSSSNEALSTSLHKINDMLEELYQTTDDLAVASVEGDLSGVSQNIVPGANNTYDLGSASNKWRSLYVSENTIYIGDSQLSIDFDGNLKVNNNKVTEIVDYNDLLNKPLLSAVATSGDYEDLSNKPVLTAVAINGRFADLTNKPTTIAGYGITDAFSGDYADLSNKPIIPQDVNQLNDVDELLLSAKVTIQGSPPSDPDAGDLWWRSDTKKLKIYYDDGLNPDWVDTSPSLTPDTGPVEIQSVNSYVRIGSGAGGGMNIGWPDTFPFPPQITIPQSEWYHIFETNNIVYDGLEVDGDLYLGFGSRLGIREEIMFQDGTLQYTGYQGRELQQNLITSGIFHNKTIAEPASSINWGSSDEFGNHISVYGNYLIVGAPGYIAAGDTNAVGRAYLYNFSTGSLIATIDPVGVFEDRISANFGAACASNSYAHFIGAPGDDNLYPGRAIGYVEIRDISTGNFLNYMLAPAPLPGDNDSKFGNSIAANEQIVVISAPDYPAIEGGTGRVYIYNSTGGTLLATVENPYGEGKYGTSLSLHKSSNLVGQGGYFTGTVITVGSDVGISEIVVSDLGYTVTDQSSVRIYHNPDLTDSEFGKFSASSERYVVTSSYEKSNLDSTGSGVIYVWDKRGGKVKAGVTNTAEQLKWKFTSNGSDPIYNFGRGLSLLGDNILSVSGTEAGTNVGIVRLYDLDTGKVLNEIYGTNLGRNSVLLTDTHLIANAPGNGAAVYDYQKTVLSSTSTKGKAIVADGVGGFGLSTPDSTLSGLTDVDTTNAVTGNVLRYNSVTEKWELGTASDGGGASAINDLTDVNTSGVSDGQSLVYNSGTWAPSTIVGLKSRQTASEQTLSIADGASDDITILGVAKTYALLSIETSAAAWVTLYTDTTSRTNDAGRNEFTDPTPGSGVIAEVITSGATTQIITPGTFGWNNDGTPSTNVYAKVVNKSGSTTPITVTLKFVPLEV